MTLASYGLLGAIGLYQSAMGKVSLTRKTDTLNHISISAASYTILNECVRLLTANNFHIVGAICLVTLLAIAMKSTKNRDILSTRLTVFNIAIGFISMFSSIVMLGLTRETPMMADAGISTNLHYAIVIGYLSVFLLYSICMNERFGNVKPTSLASLVALSSIMAIVTIAIVFSVTPQIQNLNNDENIYQILSVTHKDQVETICGYPKYAPNGTHKARVWEGNNSVGYLNDSCFFTFTASVKTEANLLFNSLTIAFGFMLMASIVSIERFMKRRVYSLNSQQKKSLLVSMISGFTILGIYFITLAHKYKYKKSYLAYREANVDSKLVFPANANKWTKVYAKLNAEKCKFVISYAKGRDTKYYGCTLSQYFKKQPTAITYSYRNNGYAKNSIDLSKFALVQGEFNLGVLPTAEPIKSTIMPVKFINAVSGQKVTGNFKAFQGWNSDYQLSVANGAVRTSTWPFVTIQPTIDGFYSTPQKYTLSSDMKNVVFYITPIFEGMSRAELTWQGDADLDLVVRTTNVKTGEVCEVSPSNSYCPSARHLVSRDHTQLAGKEIVVFKNTNEW